LLEIRRERPGGVVKIACPVSMARNILAPLLPEFLGRYPELRVEIEPYAAGWDQEPREDVDVFFKLRAPRDSIRRVRAYPGTKRALFANPEYLAAYGSPVAPEDLQAHTRIGSGVWKLSRGARLAAPNIVFRVVTSDPGVHLGLAEKGLGIAILPLYMAKWPGSRERLIPVLREWIAEPITVCALFSGAARLTPKVQVLLDFLGEYLGTDRDPRLRGLPAKGMFTDPMIAETSGP
jgi:DNA-binding transcriptional LysR family regulator